MNLKGRLKRLESKYFKEGQLVTTPTSPANEGVLRSDVRSWPLVVCKAFLKAKEQMGVSSSGHIKLDTVDLLDLPPEVKVQVRDAFLHGSWRGDPDPLPVTREEYDELRDWIARNCDALRSFPAKDQSQHAHNEATNFRHRVWGLRYSLQRGPSDPHIFEAIRAVKVLRQKFGETVSYTAQGDAPACP